MKLRESARERLGKKKKLKLMLQFQKMLLASLFIKINIASFGIILASKLPTS